MPQGRKTKDVYVIQGDFNSGWVDVYKNSDKEEAERNLQAYRMSAFGAPPPGYVYRLVIRREKKED
jgi:hypothetical protein